MVLIGLDGNYAEWFDLAAAVDGRRCFVDSMGKGQVRFYTVDRQFFAVAIAQLYRFCLYQNAGDV